MTEQKPASSLPEPADPTFVWDLPTRLCHWGLVISVSISLVTGLSGSFALMDIHIWSGIVTCGLLCFRLLWGFFGNRYARFSRFVSGPAATLHYASNWFRADQGSYLGHNPLGGWMIVLMLLALLAQVGTGLFADDDIWFSGPLAYLLADETSRKITGLHAVGFKFIIGLISMHISAVLCHQFYKRDPIILPMITGFRPLAGESSPTPWINAGIVALVTLAGLYWLTG